MQIANSITAKLTHSFTPHHLEVHNESHKHNVPPNSESHFRVVLVAECFVQQKLLQRHRAVNTVLANELANGVHALSLHLYTPAEWSERQSAPASPDCLGG